MLGCLNLLIEELKFLSRLSNKLYGDGKNTFKGITKIKNTNKMEIELDKKILTPINKRSNIKRV